MLAHSTVKSNNRAILGKLLLSSWISGCSDQQFPREFDQEQRKKLKGQTAISAVIAFVTVLMIIALNRIYGPDRTPVGKI
jgi:hypothetical protein